jgi:murein DD-endopeptidase MepM/ murein hydrolase activator NlpD
MLFNYEPLIITSDYGWRIRDGKKELHPGIDIRCVDSEYKPLSIYAPEEIIITKVEFSSQWGHYIEATAFLVSELYDKFRFFHLKPSVKVDDIPMDTDIIGVPESGFVALHLHFEVLKDGKTIDPKIYLDDKGVKYEFS